MKAILTSLCVAAAGCAGCAGNGGTSETRTDTDRDKVIKPLADTQPQINIIAHNRDVAAGDTVTLTVSSRNTLGRNARIEWTTTGGGVTPEENGRIARVQFKEPGAYTVTSKLFVDGRLVDQDAVTITARPIR
jgi:hypothetical protein